MKKFDSRLETRTKMVQELFEISDGMSFTKDQKRPKNDVQIYGMLMTLIASVFVIWFGGKPNHDLTTILGMQGMFLGGSVILAGELSLAAKIDWIVKFCAEHFSKKLERWLPFV
ncbi:hypothetical protein [uncultured Maritalea sp.]|uniref:hypothetical protein n=1 Tax=uncultured Maritalea sp. TaxID=757249 RepID=UPI002637A2FE|nr:hypothetical protein [uncultured Maritalea sp.]